MQKAKRRLIFLNFCLLVTAFFIAVYAVFAEHFSRRQDYLVMIERLKREVALEQFRSSQVYYQLKDYQQSVASLLPKNLELVAKNEQLRSLASVSTTNLGQNPIDLSGTYFQKGRRFFENKDYDLAIQQFEKLIELYPLSPFVVEAHFFIAESYFKLKNYKNSLAEIEVMITHYPDSNSTGYILLRMGQIAEINHQIEEASEIYRVVQKNFTDPSLKAQAKHMTDNVELR